MSFSIVIDNRERELVREFESRGVPVRVRPLDVGDAEIWREEDDIEEQGVEEEEEEEGVSNKKKNTLLLVVERKTWSDLSSSICDGRWAEQKRRLVETVGSERAAYVIEGEAKVWGEDRVRAAAYAFVDDDEGEGEGGVQSQSLCMNKNNNMNIMLPRVRGAMLSLSVGSSRLPVVRTRDVADTAEFLVRAAEFLTKRQTASSSAYVGGGGGGGGGGYAGAACRASAVSSRKRDNVDGRQCFLQQLCQVPGVSFAIATGIADQAGFATMRELASTLEALPDGKARLASIQRAPKVGRKIAERILALGGWQQ